MHSWRRKLLVLLHADNGLAIKNAVLLAGSYTLVALANKLVYLVMELSARRTNSASVLSSEANDRIDKQILLLVSALAPIFEQLLFRLPQWASQALFTSLTFFASYFLSAALYISHTGTDQWIYIQAALAWGAAVVMCVFGPASILQPRRGARIRYGAYVLAEL
jgi:hypothetical protein